jgi:hypothetical protein
VNLLSRFIEDIAAGLPQSKGSPESGAVVSATDVELAIPLESRIGAGAVLHASLPRGRLATGFDMPLGRLEARFEASEVVP